VELCGCLYNIGSGWSFGFSMGDAHNPAPKRDTGCPLPEEHLYFHMPLYSGPLIANVSVQRFLPIESMNSWIVLVRIKDNRCIPTRILPWGSPSNRLFATFDDIIGTVENMTVRARQKPDVSLQNVQKVALIQKDKG